MRTSLGYDENIMQKATEHTFFATFADTIVEAKSLEELVRPLLDLLEVVTGLDSTYMTTIDEAAGVQHVVYARNSRRLQIPEGITVPWQDTLCRRALDEGRAYTDDVANCWDDSEAAKALGIATYASTPIRTSDGALQGTLCAASDERKPLREGAERVLQMFSHLIGQQIERERLMRALQVANTQLAHHSLTDAVTGLPNRRALVDAIVRRLHRRDRLGDHVWLAFIDLDGFKQINDTHGHDVGDQFLVAIANALAHCHRGDDFTARLGGDEFVVVGNTESDDAESHAALLARLDAATKGQFKLGTEVINYAGPSIGLVFAKADDSEPEALIARADAAMYSVKRQRATARAQQ